MTKSAIEAAIPHRAPMLLVDEVVEQSDEHIICRKTFTPDEYFFQGHYPNYPLVPGVILCEATMQAGAILLSKFVQDGEGVPVATRLNDVKFKKMVRPGDTIEMNVKLNERMADAFFMTGKVTVDGKLSMRFDFACTVAKMEDA
ncbi:beta-hydroxyacyl-ACP dehydratase [Blastopirellula marina]|uniref:Beta-hydroxyacyl-ACP dehydratase n=1 Tax=Blastopirellula marina TaxID=124 RepID=A0A2S8F002_9BACT|nr:MULTISPECIES: 3-hydroxyacyl-ACP dehydratase FabZ [Pirellulaceae]PQO25493.1 beta-hydroxyacyl-ACP dehydratase [Blastopirellula marina]RCS42457.1 beta-hydroxyacyl-ACP dehydratase [Bremerella cremea]